MTQKKQSNESQIIIYLGLGLLFIFFLLYSLKGNGCPSKYTLEFPGRYRTEIAPHPGAYGWKYSSHPDRCDNNYRNCMKDCESIPRRRCPYECQQEKEYCEEYPM